MAAQYGVGQSVAVPVSAVDRYAATDASVAVYPAIRRVCGFSAHRTRLCVCVQQDSRTLFVVTIRLRNHISDLAPAPPVRGGGALRRSLITGCALTSHNLRGHCGLCGVWATGPENRAGPESAPERVAPGSRNRVSAARVTWLVSGKSKSPERANRPAARARSRWSCAHTSSGRTRARRRLAALARIRDRRRIRRPRL